MKQLIIIATVLFWSLGAQAQMPKLKGKLNSLTNKGGENAETTAAGENSESNGLPKGISVYSTEHSDESGLSGKYYMLYPVYLESKGKGFELTEVTIEYRPDKYNGVLHWIDDEVGKGLRYASADMNELADFYTVGAYGIGQKIVDKLHNYSFGVKNNNQFLPNTKKKQSIKDGASIMRYSKDPDIIIVSSARIFESQNCLPVTKPGDTYEAIQMNSQYSFGQQFNVLSKDPEKLKDWDSTRVMQAALEGSVKLCTDVQSAAGDVFGLPKQGKDDDALEKELFGLIQPMAATDKPIAWGDKMQFVYLNTDWKVTYADYAKTKPLYRNLAAVAVSCGWETGECRYIAVHVKQYHDGNDFGKKELGFGGSLIPVSAEKVKAFKH